MGISLSIVPNLITIFRFFLVMVFPLVYFNGGQSWALVVFITAGALDILDGYLARKYDLVTRLGIVLDPLADKTMSMTTIICLLLDKKIPLTIAILVITREVVMIIGGVVGFFFTSITIPADKYGKTTTILVSLFLVASILQLSERLRMTLAWSAICAILVTSLHYGMMFLDAHREN